MDLSIKVFDKICRACLNESPNMQPLLSKVKDDDRYLLEILASVANLDIKFDDALPKQVCNECQASIYNADAFRRRCLESETFLINLYEKNPHEHDSAEIDEKNTIKGDLWTKSRLDNPPNDTDSNIDDCFDRKDLVFSEIPVCFTSDSNLNDTIKSEGGRLKGEIDESDIKVQLDDELESNDLFSHDFDDQITFNTEVVIKKTKIRPNSIYTCHCGMKFINKGTYKRHTKKLNCDKYDKLKNKHFNLGVLGFRCETCTEKFDTLSTWNEHQKTHSTNIKNENIKIQKILVEKQEEEYVCSLCNKKFKNKKSLRRHINCHEKNSTKTYTCEECKREFKYKAFLNNHIVSLHTRAKGFSCQYCAKSFSTKESLDTHKEGHKVEKKHQCSICSKAFLMLCTLKDHMRTHTGEKPFLCSICGKGFSQKNNLAQHMRRHQGLKAFKCETCEKSFISKGELDAHERKHSGAHPFVCDDCNHGFTTSSALVKHRRIHTGERPYACDLCPMRFAASGTLKNHRRTHTGEKPFQCSYCDKAFVQRSDLVSHIRCHTGERPYVCTQCGHAFRKAAALKTHVRMHGKEGLAMGVNGLLGTVPMQ